MREHADSSVVRRSKEFAGAERPLRSPFDLKVRSGRGRAAVVSPPSPDRSARDLLCWAPSVDRAFLIAARQLAHNLEYLNVLALFGEVAADSARGRHDRADGKRQKTSPVVARTQYERHGDTLDVYTFRFSFS